MAAQPTGTREVRDGERYLVYHRQFTVPVDEVWDAITQSDRLADWFGDRHRVLEEEQQQRLVTETDEGDAAGRVEMDLSQRDGVTRLVLAQLVEDDADVERIGPRWDFRLDRLSRTMGDQDLSVVDPDDYYPALSGHYRNEFSDSGGR